MPPPTSPRLRVIAINRAGAYAALSLALGCGDAARTPADTADADSGDTAVIADTAIDDSAVDSGVTEIIPDTVATDSAAVDGASEVEVVMCGSIACDDPPPQGCSPDRLALWSHAAEGVCDVDAGGFPLCTYPVSDTRCIEGEACRVEGDDAICAAPRTTCEVALGRTATWVSAARLPADESEACCFDFDGDGRIDNGLGDLAAAIAPLFGTSAQAFIDGFIQRGLNAYLLQYRRLDGIASDADVGVDVLLGFDADGDYANNLLGNERFAVRTASYDGPRPQASFAAASFSAFVLRARSAELDLPMPLSDEPFAPKLRDVRFDARATIGDNGRGLEFGPVAEDVLGARFGALFPLTEVYRAVNTFARGSCGCFDLGRVVDLVVESGGRWECSAVGTSACNPEDPNESVCIDLAAYCGAALLLLQPDVADSISIGLWLRGLSAGLDGFVDAGGNPPTCP